MKKDETVSGLIEARRRIVDAASALPREKQDEVFLGTWSVKDLLAHLVGWDYANIEGVKEIIAGKTPSFFAHWNPDWSAYNARLVKEYKKDDYAELLQSLETSHEALINFLRLLPEEEFEKDHGVRSPGGRPVTVANTLQAEIDDEREHYEQIANWPGE